MMRLNTMRDQLIFVLSTIFVELSMLIQTMALANAIVPLKIMERPLNIIKNLYSTLENRNLRCFIQI